VRNLKIRSLALLVIAVLVGNAQATLIDRGGGLIYDDVLNVTWLQDANYANTSGYAAATGGAMDWYTATQWAAGLTIYDSVRMQTLSDWRLPTVHPKDNTLNDGYVGYDGGYNVITANSEMASLFYDSLGNKAILTTSGDYDPNWNSTAHAGPFINLQTGDAAWTIYWSGTTQAVYNLGAWDFNFSNGYQANGSSKFVSSFALLIHDGDVGAVTAVPEPATYVMVLAGLGMIGAVARRRKTR
jgi:hypothetical protein